jgi:hypothetical protein
MNGEIFITRFSAWAPGINSPGEWNEWALGKREIDSGGGSPEIAFTDSIFRRRLSQISRMTIQVIHDLLPLEEDTKIFFLSFRGELSRQYQINKMMIEEKSLMPAAFSLSVFNAPVALASIALGLKGGYSAVYPGNDSFSAGLDAAEAELLCGRGKELVFVYADEQPPKEYNGLLRECPAPLAFALLLSGTSTTDAVSLSSLKAASSAWAEQGSPLEFLRQLLAHGEIHAS